MMAYASRAKVRESAKWEYRGDHEMVYTCLLPYSKREPGSSEEKFVYDETCLRVLLGRVKCLPNNQFRWASYHNRNIDNWAWFASDGTVDSVKAAKATIEDGWRYPIL